MKDYSPAGYGLLASVYDDLVGLLFGQQLFNAQIHFFSEIPDHSNVLVLGGGTGWFLPVLFKAKPNIHVCYIDVAEQMINKAKKRDYPKDQVQFITGTENDIPVHIKYDVVLLPFFLDNFPFDVLPGRLEVIHSGMKPGAIWMVTDFTQTLRWNQQLMMWLTHRFFRLLIKHPNKKLVEWWKVFEQNNYRVVSERVWMKGWIKSMIYSRP